MPTKYLKELKNAANSDGCTVRCGKIKATGNNFRRIMGYPCNYKKDVHRLQIILDSIVTIPRITPQHVAILQLELGSDTCKFAEFNNEKAYLLQTPLETLEQQYEETIMLIKTQFSP